MLVIWLKVHPNARCEGFFASTHYRKAAQGRIPGDSRHCGLEFFLLQFETSPLFSRLVDRSRRCQKVNGHEISTLAGFVVTSRRGSPATMTSAWTGILRIWMWATNTSSSLSKMSWNPRVTGPVETSFLWSIQTKSTGKILKTFWRAQGAPDRCWDIFSSRRFSLLNLFRTVKPNCC